jgi:universal stress protein A
MKTEATLPAESAALQKRAFDSPGNAVQTIEYPLELKNILVPLDFSDFSLKALRYAVPFARQFGATLTLLHVVELPAYTPELPNPPAFLPEDDEAVTSQLETIRQAEIPEDLNVNTIVCHNFVFDGILNAAREIPADLIVTTTHGRTGLMHLLIGSTAESVVRKAPCPVLVVRDLEAAAG